MNRKLLYGVLFLFVLAFSVNASTTDSTVTGDLSQGMCYMNAMPITASDSGTLQTLNIWINSCGTDHVQMALYDNSWNLLCSTASVSCSGISNSWMYIDASSCATNITTSTTYQVAEQTDSCDVIVNLGQNNPIATRLCGWSE